MLRKTRSEAELENARKDLILKVLFNVNNDPSKR